MGPILLGDGALVLWQFWSLLHQFHQAFLFFLEGCVPLPRLAGKRKVQTHFDELRALLQHMNCVSQ